MYLGLVFLSVPVTALCLSEPDMVLDFDNNGHIDCPLTRGVA